MHEKLERGFSFCLKGERKVRLKWGSLFCLLLLIGLLTACDQSGEKSKDDKKNPDTVIVDPNTGDDQKVEEGEPITPEDFIEHFLQNDYEYLYSHTTEEFKASISLEDLEELGVPFNSEVKEYKLEAKMPYNGGTKYIWLDTERTKSVSVVFDENQLISGLWIYPVTTYPETDSVLTKTEFSFPFKGEWFILWGGTNEIVNYHYPIEEQRYAFDFIIVKDGQSYSGDKTLNESYYAYGQEVIAPADGTVVKVENEVEENVPGSMNPFRATGNYVVIDHGNGEYSLLAHFQKGSIAVNEGDVVKRGDFLGLCGNSGNSSEPHIHFQVMDSPDPDHAKSINIRFKGYSNLVQGNVVSNK
jgi:murein DD-endopeptidase MepM/ murein hydrolase activator NlpD